MENRPSSRVSFRLLLLPVLLVGLLALSMLGVTGHGELVAAPSAPAAEPQSDDFNNCAPLKSFWVWENPSGDGGASLEGTFTEQAELWIGVPNTQRHEIATDIANAPRMMQVIENGNLDLEIKITSRMDSYVQEQGMLVETGAGFIRFEFFHTGTIYYILAAILENGAFTQLHQQAVAGPAEGQDLYMRVKRDASTGVWTQSYSYEGKDWFVHKVLVYDTTVTKVGLYAGNVGNPPDKPIPSHTAKFDYFENRNDPIPDEDGDRNSLTITVDPEGAGQVAKDPDKTTYGCNESVEIEATASENFEFSDWSGDLVSTENPVTVQMNGDREITANFDEKCFVLTTSVAPENSGAVAVNQEPNCGDAYNPDTQLSLTANPSTGYKFSNWTGDATGSENPLALTMDENKAVTANFAVACFTVTTVVSPTDTGSVELSPDPDCGADKYQEDTSVQLRAKASSGYAFERWSGDLEHSVNPTSVTANKDWLVFANFILSPFEYIYLPMIIDESE